MLVAATSIPDQSGESETYKGQPLGKVGPKVVASQVLLNPKLYTPLSPEQKSTVVPRLPSWA